MADKGILFSPAMVAALLAGRKTQTRRLLDSAPKHGNWHCDRGAVGLRWVAEGGSPSMPCQLPVAVGDRRYVCETYYQRGEWAEDGLTRTGKRKWRFVPHGGQTFDAPRVFRTSMDRDRPWRVQWYRRLGRFMPRYYSRLWLLVTDVGVQRLQELTAEDAVAEGITRFNPYSVDTWRWEPNGPFASWPEGAFMMLWNSLHTAEGERWEDNPWIVAVTFEVRHGNIDAVQV